MHNSKEDPEYIDRNDAILHENITNQPQLTPTGKISHAKTRVYTQRYRKAWEQMPDFKGWLTSVPQQPTRAFCTYCKKNLHAHRLSLLKHTCTMKHQRGALMHQKETANGKSGVSNVEQKVERLIDDRIESHEHHEIEELEEDAKFKLEDEEAEDDDEDIEYVVERLDDEEIEDNQSKDIDEEEYQVHEEDDEGLPVSKKIKTDDDQGQNANRPDTLAEAMAHVHGEYLDENGESVNVELEMVVESVDPDAQEMRIVSVRSGREDEEDAEDDDEEEDEEEEEEQEITIENYGNDDNSEEYIQQDHEKDNDHENQTVEHTGAIHSSCKSSVLGESSDAGSEIDENIRELAVHRRNSSGISVRRDYSNSSRSSGTGTRPRGITVLPVQTSGNNNGTGISTAGKKTITLTSGGKTVTIDTSSITTYHGGSRFLLNTKGQESAAIVLQNEKGNIAVKRETQNKIMQQQQQQQQHQIVQNNSATSNYSVPSTSQSATRKHVISKSVKPSSAKKPCISTHVLDTSKGLPVGGLQISLYKLMDGRWTFLNESNTTPDGRCVDLVDTTKYTFTAGRYKLHFDVDKYFTLRRIETMYPFIEIIFDVKNPTEHYHVPVLISPFGYTTYRGS